ncbi:MAG: peptide deformylase [Dehalococcoidia bacterium]|nr:peptide deformylase [Dehalococcoidia bacterium]
MTTNTPANALHLIRMVENTILQVPDIALRTKCVPIILFDDDVQRVGQVLMKSVQREGGLGLAAPQIGVCMRLICVMAGAQPQLLANPEIVKKSEQTYVSTEGCLSIRHGQAPFKARRHKWIKVHALDMTGKYVSIKAHDVYARALQHEIDHLDGILLGDQIVH